MMTGDGIEKKAFVAYLDIYGFRAIVANGKTKNINKKLKKCIDYVRRIMLADSEAFYLLSDCIFLIFFTKNMADNKECSKILNRCIAVVSKVQGEYIKNDFPLRGAISYGNVVCSDHVLIGDAVVKSVELEGLVNGPVVILPFSEMEKIGIDTNELNPINNIKKLKNMTIMSALYVYPNPIDEFRGIACRKMVKHLIDGPHGPAKDWNDIYNSLDPENLSKEEKDLL